MSIIDGSFGRSSRLARLATGEDPQRTGTPRRAWVFAAIGAAALALGGIAAGQADAAAADGTLTLTAKSADVGVGWTWGNGVLHWHGHRYRFSVKGVNVAAVGYSTVTAHGVVRNLHNLDDFNGTYASSTGAAVVDRGLTGEALVNAKGVNIAIEGASKGARLSGSVDGIQLTLSR